MRIYVFAIFSILFFSGCTTQLDVESRSLSAPPFNWTEANLKRPVQLVPKYTEEGERAEYPDGQNCAYPIGPSGLNPSENYESHSKIPFFKRSNIRELPVGTKIKFEDVFVDQYYLLYIIPIEIAYYVRFTVEGSQDVPSDEIFVYKWGSWFHIWRAPWEDETVPDSRYVDYIF